MEVLEFSVRTNAEGAEALAAVFGEYAYGGPVIEEQVSPDPDEPGDPARPFTVRAFLLHDETAQAKRGALEQAVWHLSQLQDISEPSVRLLQEEDWAHAWKKHYTIQHPGRGIVIQPSWLEYQPAPGEVVLQLDPGMAFGSGLHPTTRLCLRALRDYLGPGARALDVGTGSGILAIAAAKLGAAEVCGVDVDPVAVETARENSTLNQVSEAVRIEPGSVEMGDGRGLYDLVVANILAEVIAELAPALKAHLAPGGRLIVSGILAEKTYLVELAFAAAGLVLVERTQEEDWVALVADASVLA